MNECILTGEWSLVHLCSTSSLNLQDFSNINSFLHAFINIQVILISVTSRNIKWIEYMSNSKT